jgi:flagellar biosynthesis protein FlgN
MDYVAQLLDCLREEDAVIVEFTSLLEEESTALSGPQSFDALQAITDRKNEYAARLGGLSHRRDTLLAELDLPAAHEGTEAAVVRHPELAEPWQTLLAHSAKAAAINENNGSLIDMHLRHTEGALETLRNVGAGSNLYTSQGRSGGAGAAVRKAYVAR